MEDATPAQMADEFYELEARLAGEQMEAKAFARIQNAFRKLRDEAEFLAEEGAMTQVRHSPPPKEKEEVRPSGHSEEEVFLEEERQREELRQQKREKAERERAEKAKG
eukprot:NODE_2641_length_889_cov_88.092857_g2174_i0.p1 GENE.NODE_2641_length_889_cov_88.092857_g2174_i0~~NODE_2641_length_889_cov_88.092857_g2174_i0.p1  ORF type:complete len:108 (+),score=42.95 NODE_2641_length_889_cov_88.092857_g2174_i0:366-689(+)